MADYVADLRSFASPDALAAAVGTALSNHLIGELLANPLDRPSADRVGQPDALTAAAEAVAQFAEEENIDPGDYARQGVDIAEIEQTLKARAEAHEARGEEERRKSARYYRQIAALAFLHDTEKALANSAKAAELDPDHAEGWYYLGRLQMRAGPYTAAETKFRTSACVAEPWLIHWGHLLLGDVLIRLRDGAAALGQYEEAKRLLTALAARDPANTEWQRDLWVSYNKIGDISEARGDREAALKAYQDGLDIRKALATRDPANAQWQKDLVVSAWKLASIDAPEACSHLREGLAILKLLNAANRLTADQQGWIPAFESEIATKCG